MEQRSTVARACDDEASVKFIANLTDDKGNALTLSN